MKTRKSRTKKFFLYTTATILSVAQLSIGSTLSGTVLDSKTNGPIPGVRVSIGFTDTVTYTDQNGKFDFTKIVNAKRNSSLAVKSEPFFIKKISSGSVIDLNSCKSVNTVKMFNLSGKCIYSAEVPEFYRTVQLPGVSMGMYVIQLISNNDSKYVLKWNSINALQSANISVVYSKGKMSASVSGSKKIIFRNDYYYPLELDETQSQNPILMKPDPRGEVFNESKIGRYDFTLTNADSLSMEKNALKEDYVPADFSYNGEHFGKVGLRYKGSSYSLPNCFGTDGTRQDKAECTKISLKVKFDEITDSLRFFKMKKLNLHSEAIDPSKMHDILSYELFREMGITAPRCSFAEVFLNGVFQGIYCAVEDIDGRFTDSRWPDDGDGNLYKEKWPVSESPNYYKSGLVTNDKPEDSADVSKMVSFYQAIKSSDASTFANKVSPFFDFDYWLHYIAADRVIHNADGVMTWYVQPNWYSNHNYDLYQPKAADGKIWIIPWDLHVTFSRKDPIVDAMGVPDWNVIPESCEPDSILWGHQVGVPAHCDKLIGLTADVFWNDFVKISEKMLSTSFDVKHLQDKVTFYKNLIDTAIQKDPHVDYESWKGQVNSLKNDIAVLNKDFGDYIHNRSAVEDTSGYTAPFNGTGYLVLDQLNNFEFTPLANETKWSNYYVSENSSITIKHDTINPLSGKADVLYSFVYNPAPGEGQYIEWGRIFLNFIKATDLSGLKEIQVNLKSDSNRDFWMFIASNEYNANKVNTEYGWWESTSSKGSQHIYKISDIAYPSWGSGNLPDILEKVLSKASGIGFSSNPHFNSNGKLLSVPDSGYLQIDNIRFVF
jgi:hypothetical protein